LEFAVTLLVEGVDIFWSHSIFFRTLVPYKRKCGII